MAKIVLSFRGGSYALEESEARLLCDHLSSDALLRGELSDALAQAASDQQTQIGPLLRESDGGFVLQSINDLMDAGDEVSGKLRRLADLLLGDDYEPDDQPSIG